MHFAHKAAQGQAAFCKVWQTNHKPNRTAATPSFQATRLALRTYTA
jgi:hypothetical protein